MSATSAFLPLGSGVLALAAAFVARAAPVPPDPALAGEVAAVARLAIYFGHQSVGGNVLEGVRRLAAREGVPLHLVEAPSAAGVPRGTWAHGLVGENGSPERKIEAFARALDGGAGDVDVAFMKLCYVDFHAGTDPVALFARYRAALRELGRRHPHTTFVHVTAPLTTSPGGTKALVKRLLGRESNEVQNARRERFNALMREAFAGREPLFDLARLESTRPDGGAETVAWRGEVVPALVEAYSDDGGHLNAAGQDRVARALVAFLAALPASPPPPIREER
ncbi:MAG TPA: SGNH/GDSL hydrolase family protein [Anaeromyxobacter sp.]